VVNHQHVKQLKKKMQHSLYSIESIHKPKSICNVTVSFGYSDYDNVNPYTSWSHIGSECNNQLPSMNLGFIDPPLDSFEYNNKVYEPDPDAIRNYYPLDDPNETWIPGSTVIHEVCHALGLLHEHQNEPNLELNIPAIINYYVSLGMDKEDAYTNVIDVFKIDDSNYGGSSFDIDSIMLYHLPDEWFINPEKNKTKPNLRLSKMDIEKLQLLYPKKPFIEPTVTHEYHKDHVNSYPTLRFVFIDSDIPAWKIAWVKKVITETFVPLIGVNFEFIELDRLKDSESESYNAICKKIPGCTYSKSRLFSLFCFFCSICAVKSKITQ
jgi:hypothetical protein